MAAPAFNIHDAGTWKQVVKPWVKVSGSWTAVKAAWVRDAGVWKQFYNNVQVTVPNGIVSQTKVSPAVANASIQFNTDGTLTYVWGPVGQKPSDTNWFTPTTASIGNSYWIKAVLNSGPAPTGSALNTVLALSANRSWALNESVIGNKTCSLTIYIYSDAAGTAQVAVGVVNITADVEAP